MLSQKRPQRLVCELVLLEELLEEYELDGELGHAPSCRPGGLFCATPGPCATDRTCVSLLGGGLPRFDRLHTRNYQVVKSRTRGHLTQLLLSDHTLVFETCESRHGYSLSLRRLFSRNSVQTFNGNLKEPMRDKREGPRVLSNEDTPPADTTWGGDTGRTKRRVGWHR